MRFLRRHWYNISAVISLLIVAAAARFWQDFTVLQRLSTLNLAVIFLHFYEEFGFPGGFPKLANTLLVPSPKPDRYPLNQNNVMIGNWFFALTFYLPPIFFPNVVWLGLMPVLFGGVGQLVAHAIINNSKLGTWYNSGLVTTLFGHLPIAQEESKVVALQNDQISECAMNPAGSACASATKATNKLNAKISQVHDRYDQCVLHDLRHNAVISVSRK